MLAKAALALLLALPAPALAAEVIERFTADIAVQPDGALAVTETIRVRAEGVEIRRGIYRDFPLTFTDADGNTRRVGFRLGEVTRNGQPEPHFERRSADGVRIYVGAEDVLIPHGTHTYAISYVTTRQVRTFDGEPELYWNVTGNEWIFPIHVAEARVRLSGGAEPTRADVPALILTGQWDPVTPPVYGETAARHLPNSLHLVIPHGGHGFGLKKEIHDSVRDWPEKLRAFLASLGR